MIFLTGGTGFLGQQILGRMLVRYPGREFGLLIRPLRFRSAEARVEELLSGIFGPSGVELFAARVRAIPGDLSLHRFGLGDSEFAALARCTESVFHSGATTTLNLPLEEARRINVRGTENVLELCRIAATYQPKFRLHHVSTAFVAGDTTDTVCPDRLIVDGVFKNSYERSKAEAEQLVRASIGSFPVTIYRPSVIVGDSVTGQTSAFNVLYIPARMIFRGIFKALPGVPDTPFDVVPVDYVADAIVALSEREGGNLSCYHLCSGLGRESSPREILDLIVHTFNHYRVKGLKLLSKPHFISPELFAFAQSSLNAAYTRVRHLEKIFHCRIELFSQTLPFLPYMVRNPRFDASATFAALEGVLPLPPLFYSYAERVFRYCVETNWGKVPWSNPGNLMSWSHRILAA